MPKNVSQSKGMKKWPMDANFQANATTGHKVEMSGADAEGWSLITHETEMCLSNQLL